MPRRNTFDHDVDHEMAQLLAIALDLASIDGPYPFHVVSALQTAYCVHFRAFMEFVHNGRPPKPGAKKSAQAALAKPRDIHLNDLASVPVAIPWTADELRRFAAADKLAAHLARGRAQRRHMKREWAGAQDHRLVLRRIKDTFRHVRGAQNRFPATAQLLRFFP